MEANEVQRKHIESPGLTWLSFKLRSPAMAWRGPRGGRCLANWFSIAMWTFEASKNALRMK